MRIEVVYSTRTGNTERIAEAIARELGATAKRVSEVGSLDKIDLLFVGAGLSAWNADPLIKRFAGTLDPAGVRNAAVFGTLVSLMGSRRLIAHLKDLLHRRGVAVADEACSCKGRMWFLNPGRPDGQDLARAAEFARTAGVQGRHRASKRPEPLAGTFASMSTLLDQVPKRTAPGPRPRGGLRDECSVDCSSDRAVGAAAARTVSCPRN